MGKFLSDFKAFAMKGNVIDMAVGVVIGGAFGKIVTSLVSDIIMPLVSVIIGGEGYKNLKWIVTPAQNGPDGSVEVEEVAVNYGIFIQNIVDFLIIAFCIFMAIRMIQKFKRKEEEAPAAPPAPSNEEILLTEIRDILKKDSEKSAK